MLLNSNVTLETQVNLFGEVEVNGVTRRNLMNSTPSGLTYYEIVCKPREVKDTEKIQISYKQIDRIIKEILRCGICYEIYHDPVNIKSCLHKFCRKCIEDYNRKIKKECALCRHQVETRRLMKEDVKIKEIINCLIPSIEKFNALEDNIISQYLPNFCFKDSVHRTKQIENSRRLEEVNMNIPQISNLPSSNMNPVDNHSMLNRKTKRFETNSCDAGDENRKAVSVGVRLMCEGPEDLKKYFAKTKLYTSEEISLDYFSKYICLKQNYPANKKDKIAFFIFDKDNLKVNLKKDMNLRYLKEKYKIEESDSIKLYFALL